MNNRDYFSRPIQSGGRTAHDYGHNRIHAEPRGTDRWWWVGLAVLAVFLVAQVLR